MPVPLEAMPVHLDSHAAVDPISTYYVQDKKATFPEYIVAQALDLLGYEYWFQLSFAGGRQRAGGLVLDFLVDTFPMPTPIWVQGEYWHSGAQRSEDILAMIELNYLMGGMLAEPVEIFEDEVPDVESALAILRERVI